MRNDSIKMNYFTLKEFERSSVADKYNIDNTIPKELVPHIEELIDFLNPIREVWGKPIVVTSGYRCKELNKKVGGVDNSAHTIGYGVDLVSGDFKVFSNFIKSYFQSHPEIKFDQVIIERSGKSQWIHIGLYNRDNKQRGQLFNISK